MKRRFATRRGPRRPVNMQWSDVSTSFVMAAVGATTANVLVRLESPAALSNLTSDPPEDLTILRVVGSFTVGLTNVDGQRWTLAMLVQDAVWTPAATIAEDNDKRVLWQRTYYGVGATTKQWVPPGLYIEGMAQGFPCQAEDVHLDISPRVKVEAGKALYLVAYENAVTAGTLTVGSYSMRVLYKRSGRR